MKARLAPPILESFRERLVREPAEASGDVDLLGVFAVQRDGDAGGARCDAPHVRPSVKLVSMFEMEKETAFDDGDVRIVPNEPRHSDESETEA